jgi:hypothetical protein
MDIFCFSLAAEASGRSFDATVAGLVRYVFQRTGSAAAGTHRESLPCFVSFGDVYVIVGVQLQELDYVIFRWGRTYVS